MIDPEELQKHRIDDAGLEFLNKYPEAREAAIYEFDDLVQAEAARIALASTAFVAGQRGRVMRLPWQKKHRVLAIRG